MDNRRSLGGGIKIPSGGGTIPNYGNNNALMNMMMAQSMLPQRSAATAQATQPIEIETDTQKAIRRKAGEDALKIGGILPVLRELKGKIGAAYSKMKQAGGATAGLSGGISATKEYFSGVMGRQNPELRSLIGQMNLYRPQVIRAAGDSGNFSVVEQEWAGKAFPKFGPNMELDQTFMADDTEMAEQRVQDLHDLFQKKYLESTRVAETGDLRGTGYETEYLPKLQTMQAQQQNPNQQAPQQNQDPLEGKVVVHQITKARLRRQGGQWVPIQ